MPRRDGTGPTGLGVMTGRGAGYCYCAIDSENSNMYPMARGYGCGNTRGYRRQFVETGVFGYFRNTADERKLLNQQKNLLENQLKHVKERLSEFKNDSE